MTNQEIAQRIINTEIILAKSISKVQETEYGILFYNEDNPNSYDANHAVITRYNKYTDFDKIIKKIKEFYLSKNLSPRIYSSLILGQLEQIQDKLISNGFEVEHNNDFYLIHSKECKINEPYTLNIKQISQDDDLSLILNLIERRPDSANRVYKIIKDKIKLPFYHMFVGYVENGSPATIMTLEYYNGIAVVSKVKTTDEQRGNGYARQLTRFCVNWHYENYKDYLLYLTYNNPTAGKIYREAGFVDVDWKFESWSAFIG